MERLTTEAFVARLRLTETVRPEAVHIVSERPDGPVVELDEYRAEMVQRRLDRLGKPVVSIDCGPTGAGKSTADLEAFKVAGRSLSIQRTHENCREVVNDCLADGIDAAAYPKRNTKGQEANCWNRDADDAEAIGLCVVRSVCNSSCRHRQRCVDSGYLSEVVAANDATVAVATHARAIHSGLDVLCEGRDFVAIHEDSLDVLCPQTSIPAATLCTVREVLHRLLNDPRWLDGFAPVPATNDDGQTTRDDRTTEAREARFRFLHHFADVVDRLISFADETTTAKEVPVGVTMPEPPGLQSLLFKACRELTLRFDGKPVWNLLLQIATGETSHTGVLIDESHRNRKEAGDDCPDAE
jgi:hypothetical protein